MTRPWDELEPVNILLVDDRPSNIMSLEAILANPDYNLMPARSGSEALGLVLRHEFAVIILDVAMPGMDGFETATRIKERDLSRVIPIIFVTASVYDMEHVFHGYTVGAVDYLRKPIDPHHVRSKVAVFVDLFRQRKQIERQAGQLRALEAREQRRLLDHAEEALRDSEALYQHTFEHAPIGIGHAGPDGHWTHANRRLCEILGRSCEDIVGQRVGEVADDEAAGALADALARVGTGDATSYAREHRLSTTRGDEVWGSITISPLLGSAGRVTRVIVVIDDITPRKLAEAERADLIRKLERSIRARDEFLAITAHELKTPITPLRLQTAGLLRSGAHEIEQGEFERLKRRIQKIDLSAARLEALIDRLLDFSRLSVGTVVLEPEELALETLVEEVVARLAPLADAKGSTLTIHAPERTIGRWDRLRLEQVLANLLSNAIKYGNGAPIDITVSKHGDRVHLSVADRGIGIPPADQERIFDRFERLEPVRHYGGFGIGLWIVREIVEAHGGRVSVSSRPGEGSAFVVELPQESVPARSGVAPPPEESTQRI